MRISTYLISNISFYRPVWFRFFQSKWKRQWKDFGNTARCQLTPLLWKSQSWIHSDRLGVCLQADRTVT